jgi:hypothetical protein
MSARPKKKKPFAFLVRDMVVARLRDHHRRPLDQRECDHLAFIVEKNWLSNQRVNRIALYVRALGEVDALVKKKGLSAAGASRKLYRKYGSNSPDSFARSLRSYRRLYQCLLVFRARKKSG